MSSKFVVKHGSIAHGKPDGSQDVYEVDDVLVAEDFMPEELVRLVADGFVKELRPKGSDPGNQEAPDPNAPPKTNPGNQEESGKTNPGNVE
jgi:hypothetical protein